MSDIEQKTTGKPEAQAGDVTMREMIEARVQEEQSGDVPKTRPTPETVDQKFVQKCLRFNELGDGLLYVHLMDGRHIYNSQSGEWLYFEGHHWHVDYDSARAKAAVEEVARCYANVADSFKAEKQKAIDAKDTKEESKLAKMEEAYQGRAYRLRSERGRLRCLDFARSNHERSLAIVGDEVDRKPFLLALENGVLDLETGELKNGQPDDYLVKASRVSWEGIDAPCPTWEKFMLDIMQGDEEMVSFLRRFFGMSLVGKIYEHVFLVLHGEGRNGKGTMIETILSLLSNDEASEGMLAGPIKAEMLLDQQTSSSAGPSPDIMDLRGKRLTTASETDENKRFSSARVKWLSGGDKLVGRYPHDKRNVQFDPTHTLVLLTNNKPHAPANDYAFWSRLMLVVFPMRYVDGEPQAENERPMDKDLKDKLKQEQAGIMAWLVRGCLEWQALGKRLEPPPKVKEFTAQYRRGEDLYADFFEDCCIITPQDSTMADAQPRLQAADFYDAFTLWYKVNVSTNTRKMPSPRAFAFKVQGKIPRERSGGRSYYYGVELREDILEEYREHDRS